MTMAAKFPTQGAGAFGAQAVNLVEVFRQRASEQPEQIGFTFLGEPDSTPVDCTYAQLDRSARAIAARLQQSCVPGERALLMYETGLEYIAALAGCLYAGVVAVPVYPPDPLRAARTFPRLEAIIRDADASLLLGTSSDLAWAGTMLHQIDRLRELVVTDAADTSLADDWTPVPLDRETLAFLQYTSGSTSTPKGVMVQHGNLLANLAQMEQALDVPNAIACTWLPAYHDMGLIGGILQCWYSGRRNIVLTPIAFFQQPLRWLQAISDYRVTTSAAPDFAYDLCVRKVSREEAAGLDLSCLQLALSGAEPVRAATIDRFVEAFRPFGMRREAFCPTYGLAEATLMVANSALDAAPTIGTFDGTELARNRAEYVEANATHARTLVGSGLVSNGQRVAIVDPQTHASLADGQVGEIWISGSNVAAGYWARPEESNATFRAHTDTGEGPFLRSGDLGFFHAGELFVAGRLKDLIIVHGRNHHPHDIEQTVEASHPALKPHGGAAFSVDDEGRERVVIVHEIQRPKRYDLDAVAHTVRRAVLEAHDLMVDSVVLLRQGSLSKTTSGKVQRHACRERYVAGGLNVVHAVASPSSGASRTGAPVEYVAPRNDIERHLAEHWAEVFGLERVGVNDNFFDLGGHSLFAAQLANRLAPHYGVEIALGELFERPTIAALAELIAERLEISEQSNNAAELELLAQIEQMTDAEAASRLAADGTKANASLSSPKSKTPRIPAGRNTGTANWWEAAGLGSLGDAESRR